jgi:hypothetical protein
MRQRITVLVVFSAVMVIGILSYSAHVSATLQSGVTTVMLAPKSTLAPFEVFNHAIVPNPNGDGDNDRDDQMLWLSMQATKGASDFYIVSNTWVPVNPTTGAVATTGWHSHPGHSLIVVTAGTLTDYESDDPQCKPHVYPIAFCQNLPATSQCPAEQRETLACRAILDYSGSYRQQPQRGLLPAAHVHRIRCPHFGILSWHASCHRSGSRHCGFDDCEP